MIADIIPAICEAKENWIFMEPRQDATNQ